MKQEDVTQLTIEIKDGTIAPRYKEDDVELTIDKAVITEKGMESNLPLIDFQMTDADGKVHFAALSGRLILSLAAAIKGVNMRNHGTEEP